MKGKEQPTAVQFWFRYIQDVCSDVHDVEYTAFLAPAVLSHCRSYARLTNRSTTNIQKAVDAFFAKWEGKK